MANGIANKEKKSISIPAGQNDASLVCVARIAKTRERGLDGAGKEIRGCKEQIQKGEYVTIKVSDRPIPNPNKSVEDNEMTM